MIKKMLVSILVILFSFSAFANIEKYYKGCENLKGNALKSALHEIIKGHKVYPYFDDDGIGVSEMMEEIDIDPQNPDNIICFYSGFSYPKNWIDKGWNKDYEALGTTHDNAWNREHVWSKSHGFPDREKDIAYSDIHNLRPEDSTVNTSKGAKDFDWGGFPEGEVKDCYTDVDSWEAPDRVKGDIARCIFYMAVRYEGTDTPYDLEIVDYTNTEKENYGRLSTLLEWHKLDPPDDYERRRNQIIYEKYQKNRNPFIDHPEFAYLIWGEPQYEKRIAFSHQNVSFSAVQGEESQQLDINVTVANNPKNIRYDIDENTETFAVTENSPKPLIPLDNYINQSFTLQFNPVKSGEYSSAIVFSGFKEEIKLNAYILPENGKWIINEQFSESLADFDQLVLQGDKKFGWNHSSWDNDQFARVRGTHGDFENRECWLISPVLDLESYQKVFINFRTARSRKKSDQLTVYLASELPVDGIPADAELLKAILSEGKYDWQDSGWLELDDEYIAKNNPKYLLFRYYYDGFEEGQESWQLDDIKIYGSYK